MIGVHIVCKCRLCTLCAHYLSLANRKLKCVLSLHKVCITKVCNQCWRSMHQVRISYLELITKCALSVYDADFAQTYCRLGRVFATKSLFSLFWRACRANTLGPNDTKLCRPWDLARHRQVPKAVFTALRERTSWYRKTEKWKKCPCLTRFCALAEPRSYLQMRPNSANFETLPGTNGISSLSSLRLF